MGNLHKFDRRGQGKFTLEEFRQLPFFGGKFCSQRRHRKKRPLSTKYPVHVVLKSSQAKGLQSFLTQKNRKEISYFLKRTGSKWGVKIIEFANVGNHLHLLIQITNLSAYKPFVCAVTGGIATIVTKGKELAAKFWDYRPYSRIVYGRSGYLKIRDYIEINQFEGGGHSRCEAVLLVRGNRVLESG